MLPVQRIVKQACEAGLAWIGASESRFRSFLDGYDTAEQDALWAQWQDVERRPTVHLGYPRAQAKHPALWVLQLGGARLFELAADGYEIDAADAVRSATLARSRMVQIVVTSANAPEGAMAWCQLAQWAVMVRKDWIHQQAGVLSVVEEDEADMVPLVLQDQSPTIVYQSAVKFSLQTQETKSAPLTFESGEPVTSVLVMPTNYTDEDDNPGGIDPTVQE